MRTLPKVVASTEVGKSVELKIWRDKKLISKRLIQQIRVIRRI